MISTHYLTLGMGFVLAMGLFSGCTSQSKYGDQGKAELLKENPLEPCPDSPNCVRESREIAVPSEKAEKAAKEVIIEMDGKITSAEEAEIIKSEFKAFVFTDDFEVAVTPLKSDSTHSVIHIRSASRVGKSDLGVNPKRVTTFWETLSAHLD